MKQYKITAANFAQQSEPDAVMDTADLNQLRKLAGLTETSPVPGGAMTVGGNLSGAPQATETGIESPLGSNISYTAKERRDLEREYHAQPGTDLWFLINFTKPYLNGSLRDQIEKYLSKNPQYRQRPNPGE
jgi:hypothetical protein